LRLSSYITGLKCPSNLTGNYFHLPTPQDPSGAPSWSPWKPLWKPWQTLGAQSSHCKFG
jgi:hypothetical protein